MYTEINVVILSQLTHSGNIADLRRVTHGGDEKRRDHLTPNCVHCCLKLKVPIKMCALAVYDDIIYMRHPLHCSCTDTALHKCRMQAGCGNGWVG